MSASRAHRNKSHLHVTQMTKKDCHKIPPHLKGQIISLAQKAANSWKFDDISGRLFKGRKFIFRENY